ncbi:MAG: SpoIIE family protein phosphatase [Anaerolineae bacterium]|nr:MAG: SpoIIE family protein phosphatase [Anaerolineae bacterium]
MNSLSDRFAATLAPDESETLADVRHYFAWQDGRQAAFVPSASDDVDLRTYLLDLRTASAGTDEGTLRKKIASLRRFYEWAQAEGVVDSTPFDTFDFDQPILSHDQIERRQDSLVDDPQEREIARLRALNRLAQALNRSADVQTALDVTLETLVEVMGLRTAWVSLLADGSSAVQGTGDSPAHGFALAAAYGLPPELEQDDRYYLRQGPACHCQSLLCDGRLTRAVNVVECSRLKNVADAVGDVQGLRFHATVPIISQDRPLGVLNVATDEWQFLTTSDLQLLSAAGAQIAVALERARLYDLAQAQRTRLEQELEMARVVQASLLPDQLPHVPGFDLAADWRSAREVAGDFYDIFRLPAGRWGIVVADVSDKGAPAALYMAMVRSLIRATAARARGPAGVLRQVNRALIAQSSSNMFATVFYAVLDPAARTLTYANAGHNRPIVRRASASANPGTLPEGGLPVGLFRKMNVVDTTISLAPGDVLVAYTDGLTEAFNADREMFGDERLIEIVGARPAASAQELLEAIMAQVTAFAGQVPQADDITLLVMQCRSN